MHSAEVREVRVTTQLRAQVRRRGVVQIGRHHRRGAAIETERRRQHASVPDRDELGNSRAFLIDQHANRITRGVDCERGVRLEWDGAPRGLPPCDTFFASRPGLWTCRHGMVIISLCDSRSTTATSRCRAHFSRLLATGLRLDDRRATSRRAAASAMWCSRPTLTLTTSGIATMSTADRNPRQAG